MTQASAPGTGPKVAIPQAVVVNDLANLLDVTPVDVIKELMKNGVMATINQVVDFDTAAVVAADLGFFPEEEGSEDAAAAAGEDERPASISLRVVEEGENLAPRPPVVTVLGHVDHGKTTLLDTIRRASVVDSEAGGITQHIGAYQASGPDGRALTFIDTPGHAAFSEMRARGAQITDVAIIVVAADDGVMPQTREAIDHARAAEVPIVVAMNKSDLPNANPDRAKQQLMEVQVVPEEYGGDTPVVEISALQGEGIEDLLENVLLVADLDDPRANPDRDAVGVVIEASTDPRRGIATTLLVQTGTLHTGDVIRAGLAYGKIKAMTDHTGQRVKQAGPSTPVTVLGLSEVPPAGERVVTVKNEKIARAEVTVDRRAMESTGTPQQGVTLDSLFGEIHRGAVKDFNIVLKTDVQGSIEPLVRAIESLAMDEISVKVIHAAAGTVNESDVNLAVASQGRDRCLQHQDRDRRAAALLLRARGGPRLPRDLRRGLGRRAGRAGPPRADLRGAPGRRHRGARSVPPRPPQLDRRVRVARGRREHPLAGACAPRQRSHPRVAHRLAATLPGPRERSHGGPGVRHHRRWLRGLPGGR